MNGRQIRLVLIGPPGVGKGTQSHKLSLAFSVPEIGTGDMFRHAVMAGSPLGVAAKAFMDKGELVPDETTIGIVEERLRHDDAQNGFVMDGFPRTAWQATALDSLLGRMGQRLTAAIEIEVPRQELLRRLAGRWTCGNCAATYQAESAPPLAKGICDRCATELVHRSDDDEKTVAKRLDVYERQTSPLINYYRGAGVLKTIDGERPVDDVFKAILAASLNSTLEPT